MWLILAQGTGDVDLGALAQLIATSTGIALGGWSVWRGRHADQREEVRDQKAEIEQLWDENRSLRNDVTALYGEVGGLRRHVLDCERDKADLSRRLAEALGGRS